MNAKDIAQVQLVIDQSQARLDEYAAALAALKGAGEWVVYTGRKDCPVWTQFNDSRTGVLPGISLRTATRIPYERGAQYLAGKVRNGHGEVGHCMREREAYEVEMKNLPPLVATLREHLAKQTA